MTKTTNVFDGKNIQVMHERCDTCIFRPGNLMMLRAGRVKEMVKECLETDSTITCHKTLDESDQAICRGFYDRYAHRNWMLRLAQQWGIVINHYRKKN